MKIPFNKPYLSGNELKYIRKAVELGKLSGNGFFTNKCHEFFKTTYGFDKVLLTNSGTSALEMASLLIQAGPDDEVIVPSFSFVSDANAFALRGVRIVFADSGLENPNISVEDIRKRITPRTKAVCIVHYGGIACPMDEIMNLAEMNGFIVIEDAAQAVDAYYKDKPLGSLGQLATFSFHETKNIISGEGGMLAVNDRRYQERSEILWEKGTNRTAMLRGEIEKYEWLDLGSSFLPSEMTAAFLFAQFENLKSIQRKRVAIWNRYYDKLKCLEEEGRCELPKFPEYATQNGHLFYLICRNREERNRLIEELNRRSICAIFHYLALHQSPFYRKHHPEIKLPNAERYASCLIRLPLYCTLKKEEQDEVVKAIKSFYRMQ